MSGGRVRVEVLGPIRAVDEHGHDVTPPGALQRRLLALLVLRRGNVVPVDVAIDALWPDGPPRAPQAALQNHLSRLRRVLPDGAVESVGDGYRLRADVLDVDADLLARWLADDGSGGAGDAGSGIEDVLARWHGPAYPELADVDDGRLEALHLEELRTRAREQRAARRLREGDAGAAIADLTALVDEDPLRERPTALLMDALVATGRRAEALRAFDDLRRALARELGIDPSPELVERHARLLDGAEARQPAPTHRVPVAATTLIGRDDLAAEVVALADAARVVTLVGPGGVGKTRLLLEVGRRLRDADPTRPVAMCELSPATPDTVVDAVAGALGIDARPGVPLVDRVAGVLGDSDLVLLLDNCEHVLDEAAEVVDRLVAACGGMVVIATSRERLRLPGEHVRHVPPLAVTGERSPALELFLERARAARAGTVLDDDARALACEIVRRLDGLPLAIELAAARLHTHELDEIADGLDRRFALLSSGFRTSHRHASLSAAVSWSFDVLDAGLQRTFAALSVFSGSFTAGDAADVCDDDVTAVATQLGELVERSLVMRAPGRRYVLLETMRAYAAERLAETGATASVHERHARHVVSWIARTRRRLATPADEAVLDEIDAAVPELRTALDWLLDHGDVEQAGAMLDELFDYGMMRLRPDVLAWAERVAAADPDDASPFAAHVWALGTYAAWMAGDMAGAGERCRRALVLAEGLDEVPFVVSMSLGLHALVDGRLDESAAWFARAPRAGDVGRWVLGRASVVLALGYSGHPEAPVVADEVLAVAGEATTPYGAYAWYCAGEADLAVDEERARARFTRAIEIAEATRTSFVIGTAGASRASIDARSGDPHAAAAQYRHLIDHWRRAGTWSTQWTMLRSIAGLLDRLGRHHDAAVLVGAIHATHAGHRIFGSDEVTLRELDARLTDALGADEHASARAEGARLDGDAAVEHALRAL